MVFFFFGLRMALYGFLHAQSVKVAKKNKMFSNRLKRSRKKVSIV
jgi:hypothetical protein